MSAIFSYCTRLFVILSKKYEVRLFINYKLALKLGIGIIQKTSCFSLINQFCRVLFNKRFFNFISEFLSAIGKFIKTIIN